MKYEDFPNLKNARPIPLSKLVEQSIRNSIRDSLLISYSFFGMVEQHHLDSARRTHLRYVRIDLERLQQFFNSKHAFEASGITIEALGTPDHWLVSFDMRKGYPRIFPYIVCVSDGRWRIVG